MTMEILCRIIEENNIPKNVHFMSDSGWEGGPTEMDGLYYHRESNTIVFTQGDSSQQASDGWEILYMPELIKLEELEVYPADSVASYGVTEAFKKEIKAAGDFESYYGIPETDDAYNNIDLRRPLFYCLKMKGKFIGYIGFHGDENVLEPEIYIFEGYRHRGYGTRVLKKFIDIVFEDGLTKRWREENKEDKLPKYICKKKTIVPSKIVSTVRVENIYARQMMRLCGFIENRNVAAQFAAFTAKDDDDDSGFIEVMEYQIAKE